MRSSADVVVLGGGVMGASILFNLAKRGVTETVLVERAALGAGSTGRSSGIVRMHYTSEVNVRIAFESLKILENFDEIVGGDPGLTRVGVMFFAGEDTAEAFRSNVAMQQRLGVETSLLTDEEVREVAPYLDLDDTAAVCYEPNSGYADPPGVLQAYASAARDLGAELVLDNPALDIEISGGKVSGVVTRQGRVETDTAIIATGPWTPGLLSKLDIELPLMPTRHPVFFLKRSLDKLPTHPVIGDLVNLVYFRPESPDLTLVGDVDVHDQVDPDTFDQTVGMDYVEQMWPKVNRRIPLLAEAELFTGYSGLYTETPDNHPVIDKVEGVEGLYICTGFSGHGFKESPFVGVLVAEMVLDGKAHSLDISAFRMDRFKEGALNETGYVSNVIA